MTGYRISLLILTGMLSICMTGHGQPQHDTIAVFLPLSGEVDGWKSENEPKLYTGEKLFELIDGGADVYMEYGFEEAATAEYLKGNDFILVEIYRMKDDAAAYGIFSSSNSSEGKKSDIGQDGFLFPYYLIFWKGNYYVSVSSNNDNPYLKDAIIKIGESIDNKIICTSKKPDIINLLSIPEIRFDEVIFIRGNIVLNDLYSFDTQDIFKIREGVAGLAKTFRVFIFRYGSNEECNSFLNVSKSRLSENPKYKGLNEIDNGFILIDRDSKTIRIEASGRYILVIIGKEKDQDKNIFDAIKRNILTIEH
jgi:hypothetical protein